MHKALRPFRERERERGGVSGICDENHYDDEEEQVDSTTTVAQHAKKVETLKQAKMNGKYCRQEQKGETDQEEAPGGRGTILVHVLYELCHR